MKRTLPLLAIWLALGSAPSLADIDNSAYEPGVIARDERKREDLKEQVTRETEIDRARAEAEAHRDEQARKEALAREAARPYPERLTEQHCTACHSAENYTTTGHTWLMWRLVVARMVWLNDAPVPFDDQGVIAEHLSAAYPAAPGDEVSEYAVVLAALLPILGAPWAFFLLLGKITDRRRTQSTIMGLQSHGPHGRGKKIPTP